MSARLCNLQCALTVGNADKPTRLLSLSERIALLVSKTVSRGPALNSWPLLADSPLNNFSSLFFFLVPARQTACLCPTPSFRRVTTQAKTLSLHSTRPRPRVRILPTEQVQTRMMAVSISFYVTCSVVSCFGGGKWAHYHFPQLIRPPSNLGCLTP